MGAFRCEMNDTAAAALHTRPLQIEHDLPRALTPHALCSPSASALSASPHMSFASASKLSSSVTKRSWMSGAVWAPSDAAADALALAWCPRPLPLSHKLCVLACSSN